MRQQATARMPKAVIAILVLSLIALVLFAGHSEAGPPPAAAQNQLVWVRDGQPIIYEDNEPTSGKKDPQLSREFAAALTEEISTATDTDLWRLDDVYVEGYVCNGPSLQEHGAFGLRSLSLVCDGEFSPFGVRAVHTEGTMWIDYPDLLQGGQPAVFTAEAAGSMTWELTDTTKKGKAVLTLYQFVSEKGLALLNLCGTEESVQVDGGATGSAEMQIDRQTCSYNSGVDFSRKNEVNIIFKFYSEAGDSYWFSSYGVSGTITLTYKRCLDPNDCEPPEVRRPVLIVPGILGSYYYSTADHQYWVLNRGVRPARVVIDPLTHAYDDLIQTLKNVGYVEGKDLFIAAYDWRLTPGPVDGTFDGHIGGLTGTTITDTTYEYGVDYLGFWLRQAAEAWQRDHPGQTLDSVDVISHSTGGLVARSYIQSDAYGDTFVSQGKTMRLPRINNLIMVSVPNRGASQPWQAMNNNFIIDEPSKYVIAKMLNIGYQKVQQGETITGFPQAITPDTIRDDFGNFSPTAYINQYVPTFRSLLATYDFYIEPNGQLTNLNMEAMYRNDLLLDLNSGLDMPDRPPPTDPSPFANDAQVTVIYSDSQYTAYRVQEEVGPATKVLFRLDNYIEQDVPAGYIYYRDMGAVVGDGTVPRESLVGQFEGDTRVSKVRVLHGNSTHTGLMSNPLVQQRILDTLGAAWLESDISTGLAGTTFWNVWNRLGNVWNVTSDPVEMFLVDGSGRRLGYSQSTGPVTEIPNSVWYGDADGLGWVFGPLQEPLTVTLTGLGGEYYAQVSGQQVGMKGGMVDSGTLAQGEKITSELDTVPWGSWLYLPTVLKLD